MKKFNVTFSFPSGTATVLIEADTEEAAIFKARDRECPPIPEEIKAVAVYAGSGGKRPGAPSGPRKKWHI